MELTDILLRLEAATSRLEDMASSTLEPRVNGTHPPPTGPLPPPPTAVFSPPAPKPVVEEIPESVEEFDAFLAGGLKDYVALSKELGGVVAEQVGIL